LIESIGRILKDEGFVEDYAVELVGTHKSMRVVLKYGAAGCVINGIRRESRPGLRKYVSAGSIPRILSGMGISILSTSSGVMSSREARRRNVGGEFLASVW
jgi:small subunit ribosomal protein S8